MGVKTAVVNNGILRKLSFLNIIGFLLELKENKTISEDNFEEIVQCLKKICDDDLIKLIPEVLKKGKWTATKIFR